MSTRGDRYCCSYVALFVQLVGLLAQATSELDSVDSLRETADSADRLHHEIAHLHKQVLEQEMKLDTKSQSFRSLDQVSADFNLLEGKRYNLNLFS